MTPSIDYGDYDPAARSRVREIVRETQGRIMSEPDPESDFVADPAEADAPEASATPPDGPAVAPAAEDGPKAPEPVQAAPAASYSPPGPNATVVLPEALAPEPPPVACPENHATHPSRLPPAARPVRQGV